jgi:hypothetical protein
MRNEFFHACSGGPTIGHAAAVQLAVHLAVQQAVQLTAHSVADRFGVSDRLSAAATTKYLIKPLEHKMELVELLRKKKKRNRAPSFGVVLVCKEKCGTLAADADGGSLSRVSDETLPAVLKSLGLPWAGRRSTAPASGREVQTAWASGFPCPL